MFRSCLVNLPLYIVLESRQITVSGGRREPAAGAPLQYTTPLNCTVWTSCTGGYHKVNFTILLVHACAYLQ